MIMYDERRCAIPPMNPRWQLSESPALLNIIHHLNITLINLIKNIDSIVTNTYYCDNIKSVLCCNNNYFQCLSLKYNNKDCQTYNPIGQYCNNQIFKNIINTNITKK